MTAKEKAELRLNCLYAADNIMRDKKPRPTKEDVLNEAQRLWE